MMEQKYLSKDIIGKQVIDANAKIIGTVKDVSFDLAAKDINLIVSTKTGVDVVINVEDITGMDEVTLLSKPVELPAPKPQSASPADVSPSMAATTTTPVEPGFCGVCKYQNEADSNFCIKCGAKLK
jgi:sporulation protein YlmC with PRC-barrel domain